MKFEEIKNDVEKRISEHRFNHVCGVMKVAEELSKIYKVDLEKAKVAAIVHDVAKEMQEDDVNKFCKDNNIELGEITNYPKVIHSHLGAYIAKLEYGIEDDDILNAIKYHTTGRPDMSMLEKVIYLADFLDESRDHSKYQEVYEKVKTLAYDGQIDEAMKYTLERTILYLQGNIYIDTVNAYSFYNK